MLGVVLCVMLCGCIVVISIWFLGLAIGVLNIIQQQDLISPLSECTNFNITPVMAVVANTIADMVRVF